MVSEVEPAELLGEMKKHPATQQEVFMVRNDNFPSPLQIALKNGEGTTGFLAFKASVQLHGDYGADKKLASSGGSVK